MPSGTLVGDIVPGKYDLWSLGVMGLMDVKYHLARLYRRLESYRLDTQPIVLIHTKNPEYNLSDWATVEGDPDRWSRSDRFPQSPIDTVYLEKSIG